MRKILLCLTLVMGVIAVAGCYYDKEELLYPGGNYCSTSANKFAANVFPIIQSKCATTPDCHASGSSNTGGPLTDFTKIHNMATVIRGQVISGLMPKTGSITEAEKQSIICWIDSGAPQN